MRATQAIIADPQQAADGYRWYRPNGSDIQRFKDGITIDSSGHSALIRALSKLIPVTQKQNNDGWLSGTRDTQLPTAAAFGAPLVADPSRSPATAAGGSWVDSPPWSAPARRIAHCQATPPQRPS